MRFPRPVKTNKKEAQDLVQDTDYRAWGFGFGENGVGFTHRLLSSSFLGLPYRILNTNHKKELLRSLWVGFGD